MDHRGHAFVLPAAAGAADAALAGRALLCSRSADRDHFVRLRRALVNGSVRAVHRLSARCWPNTPLLLLLRRLRARYSFLAALCRSCDHGELAALDYQGRRRWPGGAADDQAEGQQAQAVNEGEKDSRLVKAWGAGRAKLPARPEIPTGASDSLAAFRTKIRLVHVLRISIRERLRPAHKGMSTASAVSGILQGVVVKRPELEGRLYSAQAAAEQPRPLHVARAGISCTRRTKVL